MHTRSFIFFTRILARAQISSLTSEGFFIEVLSVTILETTKTWEEVRLEKNRFYRSQFWRLQKPMQATLKLLRSFIGHNFGDYKNPLDKLTFVVVVLSVTILETTKTWQFFIQNLWMFYRSQFWRLQKPPLPLFVPLRGFIGHNFGDYKNHIAYSFRPLCVLSVTILETTKTAAAAFEATTEFYRSQFWRLQKQLIDRNTTIPSFIGHNFGDYKNVRSIRV